jgi:AcrR family transcriptional regulator
MKEPEASDTRSRILDAAEEIARRNGLDSLSMRAIAERIGLSAPAAYRHFRSKSEIVRAMIDRGRDRFARGLAAARRGTEGPEEILAASTRYYLRFWLRDRAGFRLASEWGRQEPYLTGLAVEAGSFGDVPALVAAILGGSRDPGEAARIGRWVASTLYGTALSLVQDEGIPKARERELVDSAADFLVGAVRAAASGRPSGREKPAGNIGTARRNGRGRSDA